MRHYELYPRTLAGLSSVLAAGNFALTACTLDDSVHDRSEITSVCGVTKITTAENIVQPLAERARDLYIASVNVAKGGDLDQLSMNVSKAYDMSDTTAAYQIVEPIKIGDTYGICINPRDLSIISIAPAQSA